jgi:hypothetical protein
MDKINLSNINRIAENLREILAQAPEEWVIEALHDYMDRGVSIEEIRRNWERYKATQDANEQDV